MPGFTIHIAIAKEYAKKHKKEIINEEEFVEGTISPDYISIINPNFFLSNLQKIDIFLSLKLFNFFSFINELYINN